jgi:hypothetical protein
MEKDGCSASALYTALRVTGPLVTGLFAAKTVADTEAVLMVSLASMLDGLMVWFPLHINVKPGASADRGRDVPFAPTVHERLSCTDCRELVIATFFTVTPPLLYTVVVNVRTSPAGSM